MRETLHFLLSSKPVRIWVRRITRLWLWITTAAFIAYALMNDEPHPMLRRLLMFVAIAEGVALTLDTYCRRIDEVEAKALRDDLEAANERISHTTNQIAEIRPRPPWRLSDDGKKSIVSYIGRYYLNQKFTVEVGIENVASHLMANDIFEVLRDAAQWHGTVILTERIDMTVGVCEWHNLAEVQEIRAAGQTPASWQLYLGLVKAGLIGKAGGHSRRSHARGEVPRGIIVILVGTKPPEL
jgi:hypothetical protein